MSEPLDFCKKRMSHIKRIMEEKQIDAIWLSAGERGAGTYRRLVDTSSGTAVLIPRDGNPLILCFPVDYESTKDESWLPVKKVERRDLVNEEIVSFINEHIEADKGKVGLNAGGLSFRDYDYFRGKIKGEFFDITQSVIPEVFFGLYPEEIRFQRRVSQLADIAEAAAREAMAPGVKEHEIAAEANYAMMRRGAEQQSFPTIISSGERSAYCHGFPGERQLMNGDLVIVDLGPSIHGYAADETRTFLLGKDEKKQKMLTAIDKAVQAVIDSIIPEASCAELDAVSRKVLSERGFPDYPHTLGHSLSGFVVPALSKASKDVLKPGMVFTVEPGIYVPGYGGVRMEENVVITDYGFEQLTKSPRLIS